MDNDFKFCHNCGARNTADSLFCADCGTKLSMAIKRPPLPQPPPKQEKDRIGCGGMLFIGFFVCVGALLLLGLFLHNSHEPVSTYTTNTQTQSDLIYSTVNTQTFVCKSVQTVAKMETISRNKDYGYAKKLEEQGELFIIDKGTSVRYSTTTTVGDFVWVIVKSGYHAEKTGYIPRNFID